MGDEQGHKLSSSLNYVLEALVKAKRYGTEITNMLIRNKDLKSFIYTCYKHKKKKNKIINQKFQGFKENIIKNSLSQYFKSIVTDVETIWRKLLSPPRERKKLRF